ncbi:MAG: hypothetical protein RLZZ199_1737 [Actinomycetota bacterium]|jgi:hypothetical protein
MRKVVLLSFCITLVSLSVSDAAQGVVLTSPVRACLQKSIGKSATLAIVRAKKLTAKQARSVTACKKKVATPTTTTSPVATTTTTVPVGPVLVYDLDPALSESDVAKVKDWTSDALTRHEALFGIKMTAFTTNVSRDPAWLGNRDCRRHAGWTTCVADRTSLFRTTWAFAGCTPAPTDIECYQVANLGNFTGDDYLQYKTFVHEVHHIVQDQLHRDYEATRAPSNTVRPIGPDWLLEGAAEYVAYLMTSEAGKTTMAAARTEWARVATGIPGKLSAFETLDGRGAIQNLYSLYAVAVDELLKMNGNTPKKLGTYYQLLSTKVGWKAAFEQAFGLTVEAFYTHFETVRPR